jgi:aspartate ammonia-lyase
MKNRRKMAATQSRIEAQRSVRGAYLGRTERDSLGEVKVAQEAYYGSFTVRALENFNISPVKAPAAFKKAVGFVKIASSQTNLALGLLDAKKQKVIEQAAREFISGKFDAEYQIDIFQAGAGTPYNMNCNEIIANRANELLGGKKGIYDLVHPNNHVNMSQSTNDVVPTSIRLTMLIMAPQLLKQGKELQKALEKKAAAFKNILKTGRTHLQDAVPVTLGQEFASWAAALEKDLQEIQHQTNKLCEIGLGGTALGTGINTHPKYQKTVTTLLTKLIKQELKLPYSLHPTKNMFETTSNMNTFLGLSSAYRALAVTLQRIAEDLKLLSMSVMGEIILPEVEPGSSIMPGKINPSIPECLQMIAYQVMGNDTAVALACQKGQLELNVTTPLILKNLVESTEILTNGMEMLRIFSINGITANKERCQELLDKSNCVATALNPHIGYSATAELVKESRKTGEPITKILKKHIANKSLPLKKPLTSEDIDHILDPKRLTSP